MEYGTCLSMTYTEQSTQSLVGSIPSFLGGIPSIEEKLGVLSLSRLGSKVVHEFPKNLSDVRNVDFSRLLLFKGFSILCVV